MVLWLYRRLPKRLKDWYFQREIRNDLFNIFDKRVNESAWSYNEMQLWMKIGVRWSQHGLHPSDAELALRTHNKELFEKMQDGMWEKRNGS